MIIGTHLIIADIIYKYLIVKTNMKLDWPSFAYGNIRPDLDKGFIRCAHTFEDSINVIEAYSEELMKSRVLLKEFSMHLGVICHFICDYFCLYHSKKYWKRDPLGHAIHEIKLHSRFLLLSANGSIRFKHIKASEESLKDLVIRLQEGYNLGQESIEKDIKYSLAAASSVCEMIIYSSRFYKLYSKVNKKTKITAIVTQ